MKGGEIPAKLTQMTTDFRKFKIRAQRCCAAVQEKSHDQVITREILWLEELQSAGSRFFSKGHQDEGLVIANANGVSKQSGMAEWGRRRASQNVSAQNPHGLSREKQTASSLEELQNSKHSEEDVVDSLICHKDQFSSVFTTFAASFCLTEDLHWPKWIANSVAVSVDVFCVDCYENYEGASAR